MSAMPKWRVWVNDQLLAEVEAESAGDAAKIAGNHWRDSNTDGEDLGLIGSIHIQRAVALPQGSVRKADPFRRMARNEVEFTMDDWDAAPGEVLEAGPKPARRRGHFLTRLLRRI